MPGDADGDGIGDAIDSDPLTPSDDFSNQPSGTTFGSIIDRGGLTVRVSEEGDPQGVRIQATGVGGPATVSVCGLTNLTLDPGDDAIVTCSSVSVQVLAGPVEATFAGTTVQVPGGQAVTITEDSPGFFQVLADPDNTEDIFVDGVPVGPGDELTVGTVTPTPTPTATPAPTPPSPLGATQTPADFPPTGAPNDSASSSIGWILVLGGAALSTGATVLALGPRRFSLLRRLFGG